MCTQMSCSTETIEKYDWSKRNHTAYILNFCTAQYKISYRAVQDFVPRGTRFRTARYKTSVYKQVVFSTLLIFCPLFRVSNISTMVVQLQNGDASTHSRNSAAQRRGKIGRQSTRLPEAPDATDGPFDTVGKIHRRRLPACTRHGCARAVHSPPAHPALEVSSGDCGCLFL